MAFAVVRRYDMGSFPIRWDETILRLVPRYCEKCESRVREIVVMLDMKGPVVTVYCYECHHPLLQEGSALVPA